MMNILVTGSNGQLGSEIRDLSPDFKNLNLFFTGVAELDITDKKAIENFVISYKIDAIINCAAYTAVDKAESEPELANLINHRAVTSLAEICKEKKLRLIHISTDYIFDGNSYKPYTETDIPYPQSVYGKTKLEGERSMQKINPANSVIIRTSWVYSKYGNNFVKTMLRLGNERDQLNVVADQIGTPTYAGDLAKVILTILPQIENTNVEVFHYSNEGVCGWYDFAKAIFEIKGLSIKVNPIESSQYPTPAQRPFYSVLNKGSIKETFQLEVPYWKVALVNCLKQLG